jgi:two-component system NarL family sensor kinase
VSRPAHEPPHPSHFRWSILISALVAMSTWWGLGLPYSLYTWLLDAKQLRWVLICYGWEVPACGLFGALLFPMLWFRRIEQTWDRVFSDPDSSDPAQVAELETMILEYPRRVAWALLITSMVGYGVGALQLRFFAELPVADAIKICILGIVTGLVGALFSFLYLEWRLAPLLGRLGSFRAVVAPSARRTPLSQKVFASSLILTVTALLLLGTIFYSRGERILEAEVGRRVLSEARYLATELIQQGTDRASDHAWWSYREDRLRLGKSGHVYLVDDGGAVIAGAEPGHRLSMEGFRAATVETILTAPADHLVDRVYVPRIVAFTPLADSSLRVVAVAYRSEFAGELDRMLRRGGVVFVLSLLLALVQGFLLSRRLTRPIEVLTRMASGIARTPHGPWQMVAVRTNDEVGELATAFNQMTARLEDARQELERHSAELERRVAEATRNITALYDVTRTTTSTLEIEDVLTLVAEKTLAMLQLQRLVLLWYPPDIEGVVDAYAISAGAAGRRLEFEQPVDLAALCPASRLPTITPLESLRSSLPAALGAMLASPQILRLPLVFKDQLLGLIVAGLEDAAVAPDLALATALASQAAGALANASLFETARRHEAELRKLSQMRAQLQEDNLRSLSRELHDGVGQMLTAIKMDLGLIERATNLDTAEMRAQVREAREQVTELLQEVRTMAQVLRPSMLDDFGLVPTLHWFVDKFAARTHIEVSLRTPPQDTRLPSAIEVVLYRVTQEALTNVSKHAKARHVDVELTVGEREVMLAIADDGIGFDVERFLRTPALGGVGLLGMRERVAYYRGRIEIRSRPKAGVQITLTIPIDAATAGDEGERGRVPLAG